MQSPSSRALLAIFAWLRPAASQQPALPKVNVVLFRPADVAPPKDAVQRLMQVGDFTEAFLVKWVNQWGYPPAREKFLDRNPDGGVRVLFIAGKDATLCLFFCFENGAVSGDGEDYGIPGALEKPYRAAGSGYRLAQ